MIVVIGSAYLLDDGISVVAGGSAVDVAVAATAAGARVELISRIGEDPDGDRVLLDLARRGVGHVAVLRDPAFATERLARDQAATPDGEAARASEAPASRDAPSPALDSGDVELALRYLTEFRVIVVVDPGQDSILAAAAAAATFSSAHLVVLTAAGHEPTLDATVDAVVVAVDDGAADAAGTAAMIGRYAAAVDRGEVSSAAFAAASSGAASPPGAG